MSSTAFYHLKAQIKNFSLGLLFLLSGCNACDHEGKNNCDWVLEAEPDRVKEVEDGFIPVCARNRVTMKQDCRLQATLEQAKNFAGKKFRYRDMKVKSPALPRTLETIDFCE